jgi:MFS family permease
VGVSAVAWLARWHEWSRRAVLRPPGGWPPAVWKIIGSVFLNGIPMGVLTVYYPLHLHRLGIDAGVIGRNLSLIGLSGGAVLLAAGPAADHLGRRPVLLAGSLLTAAGSFVLAVASGPWGLLLGGLVGGAGLVGGVGRALVNTATNPLLAAVAGEERTTAALAGAELAWVTSAALGALLAGGPAMLTALTGLDEVRAARLLLLLCGAVATGALLRSVREPGGRLGGDRAAFGQLVRQDRLSLVRLALALGLHGAGVGVLTLLPLWFALRFAVGTGPIAVWFAAAQLGSIACIPVVPWILQRYGIARCAAVFGLLASVCVGLMALASTAVLAALLYAGRSIFNGMLWPAQHALVQQEVAPAIRATATSVAMGSWTLGTTLFALLSGDLLARGSLVLTLEMGAVLFAGSSAVIHLSARRRLART